MAVTIKDIAKRVGVSYSTVSRTLNSTGTENTENKKNILCIAREMGYVPNQAVINLKKSRSYVIGLYFSAIGKMTSPFVLHDVLTEVYQITGSKYSVVVKGIDMHDTGTLNPAFHDGIIVLSQRNEDMDSMQEALGKGIPMVVICRTVDVDAPNVTTDEERVMELAMDYLIENGHRNTGIIEGSLELDSSRLRRQGWCAPVKRHGINPDSLPVICENYRYASRYVAASQLLAYKPTAMLCFSGETVFGVRIAITQAGLEVPSDVSLIGFGNWDMSGYSDIRPTAMERNMGQIAKEGARVLPRQLDDGIIDNRRIYLNNKLIIRDTIGNLNDMVRNERWENETEHRYETP